MSKIFHPLFYLLACATRQELARQVQFLKTENEILLARLPKKIMVTPEERRQLVKAGRSLGSAIKELISVVTPATFGCWINLWPPDLPVLPSLPPHDDSPYSAQAVVVRMMTELSHQPIKHWRFWSDFNEQNECYDSEQFLR